MLPELAGWNNGKGIDLLSWIGCSGDFRRAIGYSAVFWPRFVLFEDYIFREGFTEESVLDFVVQCRGDKRSVEAVVNHLHIADIQYYGCEDITEERVVYLGRILREIYEAKLAWQFPDCPCEVSFIQPDDRANLVAYQITFWQKKHVAPGGAANAVSPHR